MAETTQPMNDMQLLRHYAEHHSEESFRTLMERHYDFVYSVCRREVGDADLAEDVTQSVFLLLARKAATIREGTILTGWLFKTARFVASDATHHETRRQAGERKVVQEMVERDGQGDNQEAVWDAIEPLLNDGIARLADTEREAVLLRYFENKSFREVGVLLGTSDEAARLRTARAIEKLKSHLRRHGVTVPSALLLGLLSERAVQAAPEGCLASATTLVAKAAVGTDAGSAASTSSKAVSLSKGAMTAMSISKAKVVVCTAVLLLCAVTWTTYRLIVPFASKGTPSGFISREQTGGTKRTEWLPATRPIVIGAYILPPMPGWKQKILSGKRGLSDGGRVTYQRTIRGVPVLMWFRYEFVPHHSGYPHTIEALKRNYARDREFDTRSAKKYSDRVKIQHLPAQETRFLGSPALHIHTITRSQYRQSVTTEDKQELYIGSSRSAHYDSTLIIRRRGNVPTQVRAEAERDWNKLNEGIRSTTR